MLDVIILLCLYPTANAQYTIYPSELYDVLFGNLTAIGDLLPLDTPGDDEKYEEPFTPKNHIKSNNKNSFSYNISNHANHYDILDYHVITEKANNLTRRWAYDDPEDSGWIPLLQWNYFEDLKKSKLSRVNIQWLLHTRYFVSRALRQRTKERRDKRFKLGYLFNRLRRLSYEQLKICSTAKSYETYPSRSINVYMRFHEQVVRLDIDIRDTIDLIKATYLIHAHYDTFKPVKNAPKDAEGSGEPQEPKEPEEHEEHEEHGEPEEPELPAMPH